MWPSQATRHRWLLRWAAAVGIKLPRLPIKAPARMLTFVPLLKWMLFNRWSDRHPCLKFKYSILVLFFFPLTFLHISLLQHCCVYVSRSVGCALTLFHIFFRFYSVHTVSPLAVTSIIITCPKVVISVFHSCDLHYYVVVNVMFLHWEYVEHLSARCFLRSSLLCDYVALPYFYSHIFLLADDYQNNLIWGHSRLLLSVLAEWEGQFSRLFVRGWGGWFKPACY